jgi:hypothetical protein
MRRATAAWERHHELRLALGEHTLVADGARLPAEALPVGTINIAGDTPRFGLLLGQRVSTARGAGNYQGETPGGAGRVPRRASRSPMLRPPQTRTRITLPCYWPVVTGPFRPRRRAATCTRSR